MERTSVALWTCSLALERKPSNRNPFKTFSYRAFIVSHKFTLMYFQCFYNNLLQFALKEECHSFSFNYFINYEVTPGAHHLVTLVQFLYIIRISDRYSRHKSARTSISEWSLYVVISLYDGVCYGLLMYHGESNVSRVLLPFFQVRKLCLYN